MTDKEPQASPCPFKIVNYELDDDDDDDSPVRIVNYFFDDSAEESDDGEADIEVVDTTTEPSTSSLIANDDQTQHDNEPIASSPKEHDESELPPAKRRRRKKSYAAQMSQLSTGMINFMKEVKDFFTKPMNLTRMSPAVSKSTFEKTEERIRCYLGYLIDEKNMSSQSLDPAVFQNNELVQSYLNWLDDKKDLNPGTISNHIGGILYVLKFLNKESAPKYQGVALISQLRSLATELQKQGDILRPKTAKELKSLGKWLTWDEILECLQLQRQKFEIARGRQKAREMQDLLLIAVYCHIPPSRGLEIRTLRYFEESPPQTIFKLSNFKDQNILVQESSGDFTIHFQDFKTSKFVGHDEVTIDRGAELNRILRDYIQNYRSSLTSNNSADYLFLNSCGNPFSTSAFTKHLQQIFLKLSGAEISVNCLRSSFLTFAYSKENCTDSLKASLASALRHSQKQAQQTYDKRMMSEKKNQAVVFARDLAENDEPSTSTAPATRQKFKPGAFVALVEVGSTLKAPRILIGRVLFYTKPGEEVLLVWYKHQKGSNYVMTIDGSKWTESVDSLCSVKMRPSKKFADQYVLETQPTAIHRSVFGKE